MRAWQLILDGALDGITNMAIDAALFEEVEASSTPVTIVRFYSWKRPTLSLGRHQKVESAVDFDYCRDNGIEIVHRPTGGRAVLHDDEITYAVASNDSSHFGSGVYANYRRIAEALNLGLERFGVPAALTPETRKAMGSRNGADPPCFLSPSRYELSVRGRKIVGSAQRRGRSGFLQHGSIPITCDRAALARATRLEDVSLLDREMAGVAEFLPGRPSMGELTNTFIRGFQDYFSIDFTPRNWD